MLFFIFVMGSSVTYAKNIDLYVSSSGKDSNTGEMQSTPARTYSRAMEVMKGKFAEGDTVIVHFAAGSYKLETLEVIGLPGNSPLKLIGYDGDVKSLREASADKIPIFNGGGSFRTWIKVRGKPSIATNVTVSGFYVKNYFGAIQLMGGRTETKPETSYNIIENNIFENIGQFNKAVKPAFSAIAVSNSNNNIIRNNIFRNIKNIDKCDGLHSIYIAWGSSYNKVVNNIFDGGCGDTIKVKDKSNYNSIKGNIFKNQIGKAVLVDSFCDKRKNLECSNKKQECPSWENIFSDNIVDDITMNAVVSVVRTVGANNIPECAPYSEGMKIRIHTKNLVCVTSSALSK